MNRDEALQDCFGKFYFVLLIHDSCISKMVIYKAIQDNEDMVWSFQFTNLYLIQRYFVWYPELIARKLCCGKFGARFG